MLYYGSTYNRIYNEQLLTLNSWTSVLVTQYPEDKEFRYKIEFDQTIVYDVISIDPLESENVKVLFGTFPGNEDSAKVAIRNLDIKTFPDGTNYYFTILF